MGFASNEMRKLRESEKNLQIRLASRIDEKIQHADQPVEQLCKEECEAAAEVGRLRELALEQQEVIEVLRQAIKEKERKLDQLTNKRRKEEFYKQWLELEPVAEVEDEDEQEQEHEEGDSALSSGPSSLSPQPSAVSREVYEAVLLEIEELHTRLLEEQQELTHAKTQVRDLEKALLQETRGSQSSKRALTEKLREVEEREASLSAEVSDLREQNELLEFRVLELEESPHSRDTPDLADSGIVSPEPIHLYKDQQSKHRDRAVATVIPYAATYSSPLVASEPSKTPLSLQESGIFEDEDTGSEGQGPELSSRATQTEVPAGELLQEVQRLQELQSRVQERAGLKTTECLQQRIRELERREEALLDETYRLGESNHWLQAQLAEYRDRPSEPIRFLVDADTMTDEADAKLARHISTWPRNNRPRRQSGQVQQRRAMFERLCSRDRPTPMDVDQGDFDFAKSAGPTGCFRMARCARKVEPSRDEVDQSQALKARPVSGADSAVKAKEEDINADQSEGLEEVGTVESSSNETKQVIYFRWR